jgi:hypothetical protein
MRPHLTHLSVQCSKPGRAAVIRWTSMRDWHLRQRGRAAARCDKVDACGSSNRCLPWDAAGALSNSLSPMKCHWRSGDGVVCAAPGAGCWSILLSLRKLRGRHASARFRLGGKDTPDGGDRPMLGREFRSISHNHDDGDDKDGRDQRKRAIECFRARRCGGHFERRHDMTLGCAYFRGLPRFAEINP